MFQHGFPERVQLLPRDVRIGLEVVEIANLSGGVLEYVADTVFNVFKGGYALMLLTLSDNTAPDNNVYPRMSVNMIYNLIVVIGRETKTGSRGVGHGTALFHQGFFQAGS